MVHLTVSKKQIGQVIYGSHAAKNISDDIISEKNKQWSWSTSWQGITTNQGQWSQTKSNKMCFCVNKTRFRGHVLSKDGILPYTNKITTIQIIQTPASVTHESNPF